MSNSNGRLAVFILRFYLGLLFLFVGTGRIFYTGIPSFIARLQDQFAETPLPDLFLQAFGTVLPFVEVVVGSLLVLGLFRRRTFVFASFLLVILALGQVMIDDFAMATNNVVHLLGALMGLCLLEEPIFALDNVVSFPK